MQTSASQKKNLVAPYLTGNFVYANNLLIPFNCFHSLYG